MYDDRVAKPSALRRRDPEQNYGMIVLTGVARKIERIADYACGIAKDVLYLASGEIALRSRAMTRTAREMLRMSLDAQLELDVGSPSGALDDVVDDIHAACTPRCATRSRRPRAVPC